MCSGVTKRFACKGKLDLLSDLLRRDRSITTMDDQRQAAPRRSESSGLPGLVGSAFAGNDDVSDVELVEGVVDAGFAVPRSAVTVRGCPPDSLLDTFDCGCRRCRRDLMSELDRTRAHKFLLTNLVTRLRPTWTGLTGKRSAEGTSRGTNAGQRLPMRPSWIAMWACRAATSACMNLNSSTVGSPSRMEQV